MKDKFKGSVTSIKKNILKLKMFGGTYARTNVLFISYIVVGLFNSTVLRYFTTDAFWNIKPVLADLAIILLNLNQSL